MRLCGQKVLWPAVYKYCIKQYAFSEQQGPMKPVYSFYPSLSDGLACINRATLNAPTFLTLSFYN